MKTTRTHILNKILFEANRVSDESHRKTILKNKFNFMWKNNAWAIQRIDSSVEAWWIVVWLTEAVNVASSKSTPKYDSQMFLVQFTCTKCKRKCFSVCCRTKKTERILWIQKIVKRYVAGQIRLWPLIMKEPNNACRVKQDINSRTNITSQFLKWKKPQNIIVQGITQTNFLTSFNY